MTPIALDARSRPPDHQFWQQWFEQHWPPDHQFWQQWFEQQWPPDHQFWQQWFEQHWPPLCPDSAKVPTPRCTSSGSSRPSAAHCQTPTATPAHSVVAHKRCAGHDALREGPLVPPVLGQEGLRLRDAVRHVREDGVPIGHQLTGPTERMGKPLQSVDRRRSDAPNTRTARHGVRFDGIRPSPTRAGGGGGIWCRENLAPISKHHRKKIGTRFPDSGARTNIGREMVVDIFYGPLAGCCYFLNACCYFLGAA